MQEQVNDVDLLSTNDRYKLCNSRKPDISHLDEACDIVGRDIVPLFAEGDKIVVERNSTLEDGSLLWLDTRIYIVKEIDDDTGTCRCIDPELQRQAVVGYKHPDQVFKLHPVKGSPWRNKSSSEKKRIMKKKKKK